MAFLDYSRKIKKIKKDTRKYQKFPKIYWNYLGNFEKKNEKL